MKILLYIFLAIVTFSSCSNAKLTITEEELKEDLFYIDKQLKPYTGTCNILYHNTNNVKEEFHFINGRLHGKAVSYYQNGRVKRKGTYKDGNLSGKWTIWDESGKKSFEVYYENDTLNGKYLSYHSNGSIKEKGQYSDNRRTGEWISYDQFGNVVKDTAF